MSSRIVDIFDHSGAKLFSYSIALEEEHCLDAEFEEVALIFAESSGLVAANEIAHLRARCDTSSVLEELVEESAKSVQPKRHKTTVVSLVKHRMKRAGSGAERHRVRQVS